MKKLMIGLIIGSFIAMGFAQSKISQSEKKEATQNGPTIKKVQNGKDNSNNTQRSTIKNNDLPPGKIAFTRDAEKGNQKTKNQSMLKIKPKRVLNTDRSHDLGQGKEQIYSKIKNRKKLTRVEGYVERMEIKKIEGHSPISEEVLMRALGNPIRIKKQSDKTK
jgi:hypothetical protein